MWFDHPLQITTLLAIVDAAVMVVIIPWILSLKKDSTSAVAWCLIVVLLPLIGSLLFVVFGYTYVHRPLRRKRRHRAGFQERSPAAKREKETAEQRDVFADSGYGSLGSLAVKLGAFPLSQGNAVTLYHETSQAMEAMLESIAAARHHIHVEFYIIQSDATGKKLIRLLVEKARQGVEVRLLYDALGSFTLKSRFIKPLIKAGGKCSAFLGLNPWRRRYQVNLRNHRKIVVVDGAVGFTGGMNIGDEYLGRIERFGYWRDTHMRIEGPAVTALQSIFAEDWDFASEELLSGPDYFSKVAPAGHEVVQIVDSGPDHETNAIRELIFAAITTAEERLWIATPYLVPDGGILDALRLAARRGVDVRILCPRVSDHWFAYWASRYYWTDLLDEGVKIYEYQKGMMHAKMMVVDDQWGWVGTANLDNRSLKLNFENICVVHTRRLIENVAQAFHRDFEDSARVHAEHFANRPATYRLLENSCRLLSPVL